MALSKKDILSLPTVFTDKCDNVEVSIRKVGPKNMLRVTYSPGKPGHTIKDNVDPHLKSIDFPSIASLKKSFKEFKEVGDPEYAYGIDFELTKADEFVSEEPKDKEKKVTKKDMGLNEIRKIINSEIRRVLANKYDF